MRSGGSFSEGSADVRALAREYPEVEWVFSERNVGYAKAVNGLASRVEDGAVWTRDDR